MELTSYACDKLYSDTPGMANVRYVNPVARSPNLHRRPALLAEIVDYLRDKPLSTVTFRTLADGLNVSTYQLVYHFGNRAELIEAIIQTVADRETVVRGPIESPAKPPSLDVLIADMHLSWQLSISPRGRQLQRLEFEAAILENLDPRVGSLATSTHDRWVRSGVAAVERLGVAKDAAELEVRSLVDAMYGLHYDLILGNDLAKVSATYDRTIELFLQRIEALLPQSG